MYVANVPNRGSPPVSTASLMSSRVDWLDAVDRLMAGVFEDDFLLGLKPELEREKQRVMTDRDAFVSWLDDLAARFGAEARRRNLEASGGSGG